MKSTTSNSLGILGAGNSRTGWRNVVIGAATSRNTSNVTGDNTAILGTGYEYVTWTNVSVRILEVNIISSAENVVGILGVGSLMTLIWTTAPTGHWRGERGDRVGVRRRGTELAGHLYATPGFSW